jgi:hypothetical protein
MDLPMVRNVDVCSLFTITQNNTTHTHTAAWNATKCLMRPMYHLEISSFNLSLGELVGPTTSGVGFETNLQWAGTSSDISAVSRCSNYIETTQCEADLGCIWDYENDLCDGSLLSYRWSSGTIVWNNDAARWADLGYFDAKHFDVQVRPSRMFHYIYVFFFIFSNLSTLLFII